MASDGLALCSQAHNCCPLYPVCSLAMSCSFFFFLIFLFIFLIRHSLPVFVFFSLLPFTSLNVLQQLSALRPHSAGFVSCCFFFFLFILWCSLCRCLRLFPQRRCMLLSGHADSGPHRRYNIKQHRMLFLVRVGWFHPALFTLSLRFDWDLSCVQLSCVQYTTPFLLLPALRSRLIADAELYIQVNRWASWPLFNGCVLCLYNIHTLLLCSSTVNPSGSFKLS